MGYQTGAQNDNQEQEVTRCGGGSVEEAAPFLPVLHPSPVGAWTTKALD